MKKTLLIISMFILIDILNAMSYSNTPLFSETCWSLELCDNIMYELTDWGLIVYNITDRSAPEIINKFPLDIGCTSTSYMKRLNHRLIVGGYYGLIIFNIDVPNNPVELYRLSLSNVNDCVIYNNYFIVNNIDYTQSESRSFLHVYNMNTFPALNAVATLDSTASCELIEDNLYVINKIHLIGNEVNPQAPVRFRKFNIGNTGQLSLVSELALPWEYQNYSQYYPDIQKYNNYIWAYVRGYFYQINCAGNMQLSTTISCDPDVSTQDDFLSFVIANDVIYSHNGEIIPIGLEDKTVGSSFNRHGQRPDASWLREMITDELYLYMSFVETGFYIWSLANPLNPVEVCLHSNWQSIMDVAVAGNRMYAVSWTDFVPEGSPSGMYIYDITNPADPGRIALYDGSDDYFYCVNIRGDYAYVGGEFGLRILNVSDPQNIQLVSTVSEAVARKAMFHNNYIITLDMVSFDSDAFKVIDISNVNTPACHPIFNTVETHIPNAYDFEIYQNYLYVLDTNVYVGPVAQHYTGGLKVYDITNPLQPIFVTSINPNALKTLRSIARSGNYLYVSGNNISSMLEYEIWVVDITEPTNPSIISSFSRSSANYDMKLLVQGNRLFTSQKNTLDISDPYHVAMIDSTAINVNGAVGMAVSGNYFFEASFNAVNIYTFGNVAVEDEELVAIPDVYNYPNPFRISGNSGTTFAFSMPKTGTAELIIYNIKGQKVRAMQGCFTSSGKQSFNWNGKDEQGKTVAPGVYLYKLKVDDRDYAVKKCLILK